MKVAYAYVATRFDTELIVKILSQAGHLMHVFSCRSFKKAPEFAKSWGERNKYEIQWLANPWSTADFMTAIENYKSNWGVTLDGREAKESFQPW